MLESLTNDALDDVLSKLSLHALCKIACLSPALQTCSNSSHLWLTHYNKYCKKSSKTSTGIRNIKKKKGIDKIHDCGARRQSPNEWVK